MAYKLKYYKEIESHGHTWDLYIYQDTEETFSAVEIGPVLQGLRLVVQGDQADIDTPIVKTSLEMVFGDAPDLEEERKCGYWEEFYTSSATEYQIRLDKDGSPEWTGYITPDSFSEDLRYRGSVTIIARDNLGTLQDTTCDLTQWQNKDGKVYVYQIIQQALTVSTCAMPLVYDIDAFPYSIEGNSNGRYEMSASLLWQMVDAQRLHEMNWWEALEKVLYSIGAVLRYVGNNRIVLMPMRDLPKGDATEWWDVSVMPTRFLAFGHRELVPGIKSITETQEYDLGIEAEAERISEYKNTATLSCYNINMYGPNGSNVGPDFNVPAWGYTNPKTKTAVTAGESGLLNVAGYSKYKGEDSEAYGAWDDTSVIYMAVNTRVDKPVVFSKRVFSATGKASVAFSVDKPVSITRDYAQVMNTPIASVVGGSSTPQIVFKLKHTALDGTVKYYNGSSWGAETNLARLLHQSLILQDKPIASKIELKDITLPAVGTLSVELVRITCETVNINLRVAAVGLFMRVRDIRIQQEMPEDVEILKKLTLTTNYSDKYAVRISRDPAFVINETELPEVAYIPNALLMEGEYQYFGAADWVWLHGRDLLTYPKHTGISLARLNHQQLLAYHAKPNNLLTGELVTEEPTFNALYRWNGKNHMLMSGSLNILTGRMENVVLREFTRYDHMWETHIIEGEDQTISSSGGSVYINVVGAKELAKADVQNLPSWLSLNTVKKMPNGSYRVWLTATAGSGRSAIIKIDTAYARITQ